MAGDGDKVAIIVDVLTNILAPNPAQVAAYRKVIEDAWVEGGERGAKRAAREIAKNEGGQQAKDQFNTDMAVANTSSNQAKLRALFRYGAYGEGRSEEEMSPTDKEMLKAAQFGTKVAQQGFNATQSLVKGSINILKDIFERLKSASPLLQAIEQLFNLAMTLFFMPIGNKLAEVILPATLELVDNVVAMWEEFGGGGLGAMITHAMTKGVELFGQYFVDIGNILIEQGGLVGNIGTFLVTLGGFVENNLAGILNAVLSLAMWVLNHLQGFIAAMIGFKSAELALMIAQIQVTALSGTKIGSLGALGIAAAYSIGGFAIGAGGSYLALEAITQNNATGGYVPSTAGGSLHVIGEGGEGEYVIPESKMGTAGLGGATYNFHINGVTSEELKSLINECIDAQISGARIRGAF